MLSQQPVFRTRACHPRHMQKEAVRDRYVSKSTGTLVVPGSVPGLSLGGGDAVEERRDPSTVREGEC